MTSVYKSHTHGPIPLSATGKRLMQTLRIAIQEAIQKGDYNQMNEVAHARGELATYMSALEGQTSPDPAYRQKPAITATEVNIKSYFDWRWSGGTAQVQNLPKYPGRLSENLIQGMRPTMMILDDPVNEQELDMSKKAIATRKRAAKAEAKMQLVGVRFLQGHNLDKIYIYKVKRTAKLTLGCEVVVRNQNGTAVAVVVQLDQPMPLGYTMETVVELTDKVAAI